MLKAIAKLAVFTAACYAVRRLVLPLSATVSTYRKRDDDGGRHWSLTMYARLREPQDDAADHGDE